MHEVWVFEKQAKQKLYCIVLWLAMRDCHTDCVQQDPIATEIEEVKNFSLAEDYHQQYLAKGGRFGRPQSASKGCTDPIRCYG